MNGKRKSDSLGRCCRPQCEVQTGGVLFCECLLRGGKRVRRSLVRPLRYSSFEKLAADFSILLFAGPEN